MSSEGSLISSMTNHYKNMIDEFFVIGITDESHARKLFTDVYYHGEPLISIPTKWAFDSTITETICPYMYEIPEKQPEDYSFSIIINEMSLNCSFIHSYVVYTDMTELINNAKKSLQNELINDFVPRSDEKEIYILNPTNIHKYQKKYFYPFILSIKTKSPNHSFFQSILEELYNILKDNPFPGKNIGNIFEIEENLHFYRLMKFSCHVFFMLNDLINPSTGTKLTYQINEKKLSMLHHSVLKHPFIDNPILLCALEIEPETLIFIWKCLIIGSNVMIISDDDQKRFNVMEAISCLLFPFGPPNKISSFNLRVDLENTRFILIGAHYFIGYNKKIIDYDTVTSIPFLTENYNIFDLENSKISTFFTKENNIMDLGEFEKDLKRNLTVIFKFYLIYLLKDLKNSFLKQIRLLSEKDDFLKECSRIKKEICAKLVNYFFDFFENEKTFLEVEKYLNLKKVEGMFSYKSNLKDTTNLINSFRKIENIGFLKEMINEFTFLQFAKEFNSIDLNYSYRFKNIMTITNFERSNKVKIGNQSLNLNINLNEEIYLYFIDLVIKNGKILNNSDKEKFSSFIKKAKKEQSSEKYEYKKIKTPIKNNTHFNLVDFYYGLSDVFKTSNAQINENNESVANNNLVKNFTFKINFNEIVKNDFENIEKGGEGLIINCENFNQLKHLFYLNKSLFLHSFRDKNESTYRICLETYLKAYSEYNEYEIELNKTLTNQLSLDFPDFPRTNFKKIFLDSKTMTEEEIRSYKNNMLLIRPQSNIIKIIDRLLENYGPRQNPPRDPVSSFATLCYFYQDFLKKYFRSDGILNLINNQSHNKTHIRNLFQKIKSEENHTINEFKRVFTSMEDDLTVHSRVYTDNEKLCFYINFFNLKLMNELFFNHLSEEKKIFPQKSDDWIQFLSSVRFRLFGYELNLIDLDFSIIRQFLNIDHLFIQKPQFLMQLTAIKEPHLYRQNRIPSQFRFFIRNAKLPNENLIDFTLFLCIRDTPVYRVFEDQPNFDEVLMDHAKDYFKFFKKLNNFNLFKNVKSYEIPIPLQFCLAIQNDLKDKSKLIEFLIKFYDQRISNLKPEELCIKEISIKWDLFYLNPTYFS